MSQALKSQGVLFEVSLAGSPNVWREVGEVTTIGDVDSGDASDIDVTHLQSEAKEYLIGLKDSGVITLEGNLVIGDLGQIQLQQARNDETPRDFRMTLTDSAPATVLTFTAYVKKYGTSAGVDSKLPFNVSLRVTGPVAWN